jgi:hypothetical protein
LHQITTTRHFSFAAFLRIFPKESPDATLKEVQRVLPNATPEEAARMVELLGPGPMGMELGRLCTASSDGKTLLTAQVLFK